MKVCSKCKETKSLDEFYFRATEDRPQGYCKACFLIYVKARWIRRKEQFIQELGGKCYDCSGVFPREVYDFHHVDPSTKEFNWTKLRLRSDEKIRKELSKCVLLCANCHRSRHALSN